MYGDFLVVRKYGQFSAKFLSGTSTVFEMVGLLSYVLFLCKELIEFVLNLSSRHCFQQFANWSEWHFGDSRKPTGKSVQKFVGLLLSRFSKPGFELSNLAFVNFSTLKGLTKFCKAELLLQIRILLTSLSPKQFI